MTPAADRRRRFLSTTLGLTLGGSAYLLTLFDYGANFTRTALGSGYFSGFFDAQARALLDGRIHLPPEALGIEGFVHDGKTYTYFPPFPALLRLPVLLTTHEFDNRLTALSMAVAWVVFAVMVTKLAWWTLERVLGHERVSRTSAVLVGAFLAVATGGTFMTYDAALPWVYHEVYVWAVTAAVGALYWLLRVLTAPDAHSVRWLFAFCLVAVGTRATEGWAVCLTVIAVALWFRFGRGQLAHRAWWRWVLLAAAVPLACSIALNLYKFGNVYMFPLQDQVWTQVNAQRRRALEANGGTLTGPQFFVTSFMAYLRPDGIRFVDYFPWITVPAQPAPAYNGAVVDQAYRTGSATAFMPLLMGLMFTAAVSVFRPGARRAMTVFRAPAVAAVLVTGGVMGYGYYSTRYATEFVPALVLGGAVGTALLCRAVTDRPRWRVPAGALMVAGTAFSVLAVLAIAVPSVAYNHRGEPLQRYIEWQHRVSPEQQARRVSVTEGLPRGGRTDDLAIRGDCDALYVNTGDQYEPWLPVEEKNQVWRIEQVAPLRPGRVELLRITGKQTQQVTMDVGENYKVRLTVRDGDRRSRGSWFYVPTEGGIRLGLQNRIDLGFYQVDSAPGGTAGFPASIYFNKDWDSLPALVSEVDDTRQLRRLGFRISREPGLDLPLCRSIARTAGVALAGS